MWVKYFIIIFFLKDVNKDLIIVKVKDSGLKVDWVLLFVIVFLK